MSFYPGEKMQKKITILFVVLFIACVNLFAQELYVPRKIQKAYKNGTRSADGKPGANYWQNTANYDIKMTLAPPNRNVSGTEEITYFNNSPNELDTLVFRLELNSHQPEAPRENPVSTDYLTDGVHIDEYAENGKVKVWKEQKGNTWQAIKLDQKLAPNSSVKLSFKWHYDLSDESNREGAIDPTTFFHRVFLSARRCL